MTSRKRVEADNPEWTQGDFAKAKAPEDILSADVLSKFGKHRGPQKAPKKVPVSIRLSPVSRYPLQKTAPAVARIDAVLTRSEKEKGPLPQIRKAMIQNRNAHFRGTCRYCPAMTG